MPRLMAQSMMPPQSAPDWERNAMWPRGGMSLTKVVLSIGAQRRQDAAASIKPVYARGPVLDAIEPAEQKR